MKYRKEEKIRSAIKESQYSITKIVKKEKIKGWKWQRNEAVKNDLKT